MVLSFTPKYWVSEVVGLTKGKGDIKEVMCHEDLKVIVELIRKSSYHSRGNENTERLFIRCQVRNNNVKNQKGE